MKQSEQKQSEITLNPNHSQKNVNVYKKNRTVHDDILFFKYNFALTDNNLLTITHISIKNKL